MLRAGLVTWVLASFPLSVLLGGMIRLSTSHDAPRAGHAEPVLSLAASRS